MKLWQSGLLAGLVLVGCAREVEPPARVRERPSIVLITIDTLRADHLGCYGYSPYAAPVSPAIDALAAESVRFSRFYTSRGETTPSLCSMMVGRYPSSNGVRDNGMRFARDQHTLVERLGELGYETAAFVSRIPVGKGAHPARGVQLLEGGIVQAEGGVSQGFHTSDEAVHEKALRWLDEHQGGSERPFFLWVHYYGVHKPYLPPPPYDTLFTGDYQGELRQGEHIAWPKIEEAIESATLSDTPLDPAVHRFIVGLYDGGIRKVDERVGELLARLVERKLDRETLLVLSADHGEELGDHQNYYFHANSVYGSALHIPLLLRWPGRLRGGTTFEHLAQNVDLVPTLLDWLGQPIPPEIEGVSLAPWLGSEPPAAPPRQQVYVEWQDLVWGVRTLEEHYLINPLGVWMRKAPYDAREGTGFHVGCSELYLLEEDPLEQVDRLDEQPEQARRLRALALAHRAREAAIKTWDGVETESLPELQALGYVGSLPGREDVLFGAEECGNER